MKYGKGTIPIEAQVVMVAQQFHTTPWDVEQNMTAGWWDWINEVNRGRSKT